MKTKRCSKCTRELPLSEFGKRSASKDGLNYKCKTCCRTYGKAYRQSDHGKAIQIKYLQSEKGKAVCRKYQQSVEGKAACARASKKYQQSPEGKRTITQRRRLKLFAKLKFWPGK